MATKKTKSSKKRVTVSGTRAMDKKRGESGYRRAGKAVPKRYHYIERSIKGDTITETSDWTQNGITTINKTVIRPGTTVTTQTRTNSRLPRRRKH